MALSTQMQTRINNIELLIEKGYTLKTEFYNLVPKLTSPNGKAVNIYQGRYEDDLLPNFSWIAFWFPPLFAAQIRHWNYFWFVGIFTFFIDVLSLITKIESLSYAGLVTAILYAYWFPYQRWFFMKSNKEEFGIFQSILVGIGLIIVASIPSYILIFSTY